MIVRAAVAACIVAVLSSGCARANPEDFNRDPERARIVTEDLDRFWTAWDLAESEPERRREIFQRHYLNAGSVGLQKFVEHRIGDVDRLLAAIDAHPEYYASLRRHTPKAEAAAQPVREGLRELARMFPDAVFPDTYLVIGRMNSAGTLDLAGLLIGFDMYGRDDDMPVHELGAWHREVIGSVDALPVIIMHELVHYQQAVHAGVRFETLLGQSLSEGAADFITELVMGRHNRARMHDWALPREAELWAEFREVMHGRERAGWLYGGLGADGRPSDLGYFIGYRIARAYYERADDKEAAIAAIIGMKDPEAFLEASGYTGAGVNPS